jgi:hypothetical protein
MHAALAIAFIEARSKPLRAKTRVAAARILRRRCSAVSLFRVLDFIEDHITYR